jgi:hypothetical protein
MGGVGLSKLPLESAVYLLQQRTHLLAAVEQLYLESCRADAARIAAHAGPRIPRTCVDIGCGLGGISVVLAEGWPTTEFIMLDRDGNEGRKINYGEDFGKYNQLELTSRFLTARGVEHRTCNIDRQGPPAQVDVAFSVLSWGFHYPVQTHIEWVAKAAPVLLIDCRAGTGAFNDLVRHYQDVRVIMEKPKHEWFLCQN